MHFSSYPNAADMMQSLSVELVTDLLGALAKNGKATLAVPGGSTPGPLFDLLSRADFDWTNVTIMLTDERWVSTDSPRSNTALIRNRLLVNAAASANYVALYKDGFEPEAGAVALSKQVEPYLPIDVILLGMGADMHTASLFPGAAELAWAQSPEAAAVVSMVPVTGDLEPRVTLSANVLESANRTHVLILGDEKKAALMVAETADPYEAPIAQFLPNAKVHWSPS
jgi:6-phosphogluconolactonase|tara:strand:- start:183 stop:860 length:678 start_codon:yes stop_codon:yes gene_type:complete